MYLQDVGAEFTNTHKPGDYQRADLRPYAFNDFDTFVQRTKKSYENPRASNNLDKVNAQLKETTQIMSKNLEDLLYRGDSLDKMSTMSSDLKESSRKYKRAAVRINWELLLKQVNTPFIYCQGHKNSEACYIDHAPLVQIDMDKFEPDIYSAERDLDFVNLTGEDELVALVNLVSDD